MRKIIQSQCVAAPEKTGEPNQAGSPAVASGMAGTKTGTPEKGQSRTRNVLVSYEFFLQSGQTKPCIPSHRVGTFPMNPRIFRPPCKGKTPQNVRKYLTINA